MKHNKPHILVVDDNFINRTITGKFLSLASYTYETASQGYEAIEVAENSLFDVILLDIHMPEMDGLTTIGHLRNIQKNCFIVAFTSDTRKELVAEIEEAGFDTILYKPFHPAALYHLLEGRKGYQVMGS